MKSSPKDALCLWRDAQLIYNACDVYGNPAYHNARQTTLCFGRSMVDDLKAIGGVDGLCERVT